MKKLTIFLFSIFISINSHSGIFKESICFETAGQDIVFFPNDTNPYTGRYLCKFEDGQKEKEGRYKAGRLIGKWTVWYNNGQKWNEGNYKDGKRVGKWTWWSKKGLKVKQKNYKNGKLDGKLIEWFQFNGQIKREESYKNGKICINQC
tara:strand:+ start:16 stop:459 length:444 start_codon:yes stop_codon:yes gene_type:complete